MREVVMKFPGWTAGLLTVGILLLLRWWSEFYGLYGQDSYAYATYGAQYLNWWEGGVAPDPFFWPEGYPALGALLDRCTGSVISGFQLLSILSLSLTAGILTKLACRLLPINWSVSLAILTVSVSPYWVRSGMASMSDALGVTLVAISLWAATRYREDEAGKWLFGLVILIPLAALVRYPVALVCGGVFLIALPGAIRKKHFLPLLLGSIGVAGLAWFHFRRPDAGFQGHHFLETWSPLNGFRSSFTMADGNFSYPLPNLVYALAPFAHPGYLGILGISLPLALIRWPRLSSHMKYYILVAVLYMLFIAGIPFQNTRFLLPVLPILFLLLVQHEGLWNLGVFKRRWLALGIGGVILLVNLFLVQRSNQNMWASSKFEREVAANIFDQKPDVKLFTFGLTGALRYYGGEAASVHDLWDESRSPEAWQAENRPASGDWVLFNEDAFAEQWKGKSPMVNWQRLQTQFDWVKITNFAGGWTLHALQ